MIAATFLELAVHDLFAIALIFVQLAIGPLGLCFMVVFLLERERELRREGKATRGKMSALPSRSDLRVFR